MSNSETKVDSLAEIYENYKQESGGGDKGTRHSYIDIYEHILANHRKTTWHFLEVGVFRGHSLGMWRDYFYNAHCIGVDIELGRIIPELVQGCNILVGDATKEETFRNIDLLDIIVDDGSHKYEDQLATFELLWPKLSNGGLYIIEDVQNIEDAYKMLDWVPFGEGAEVIDLRSVKNRYDDIMVVFEKFRDV